MAKRTLLVGVTLMLAGTVAAQEIAPSADEIRPILIGSRVPDVVVQTIEGSPVGLRDAIGDTPTVLVFYRGSWCPFCSKQLADLRHTVEPLQKLGVQVIGISGDSPERVTAMSLEPQAGVTFLSDLGLAATKAFGLAFHVTDEYVEKLAQYDLDTEGNSVSTEQVLPVPAVFVIGPDQLITFSYVNPNYRVRCDADVLLAAAAAVMKQP